MGLLDAFNSPEMGLAMGLLNAGGASSRPVSLGQGIAQGYQGFQQAQENNQQRAAREQQMQMHLLHLKRMQDAQKLIEDRKVQLVSYIKDLQATNPAEAAKYQQAVSLGIPLEKVWEQANKDPKFAYHEGQIYNESRLTPQGAPSPVASIPQRPASMPWDYRLGTNGQPEMIPSVKADKKDIAGAGASSTKVFNNPKDDFKNTRDLRNDFQGLPQTKLFNETSSAYNQIKVGLNAQSAAGDLAAATKFMKMLDPGSVVRESELGMAMAATGVVDRMSNYVKQLQTGQKLTPSQRKDFQSIADGLMEASANLYSKALADQRGIASGAGLNPDDIGTQPDRPWSTMSAGGWSAKKVGK